MTAAVAFIGVGLLASLWVAISTYTFNKRTDGMFPAFLSIAAYVFGTIDILWAIAKLAKIAQDVGAP